MCDAGDALTPLTDLERGLVSEALPLLPGVVRHVRWRRCVPPRWTDADIRSAAMIRLCLAAKRFDSRRSGWPAYARAQMILGVLDEYRDGVERGGKRGRKSVTVPASTLLAHDAGEPMDFLAAIEDPSPGLAFRREESEDIRARFEGALRPLSKSHRRTIRRWARFPTAAADANADGVRLVTVRNRRWAATKAARRAAEGAK